MTWPLELPLRDLGERDVRGTAEFPDRTLPDRMRRLDPEAHESFRIVSKNVIVSAIYRSPEASLVALDQKVGITQPGEDGHNYGLSVDIAVRETLSIDKFRSKKRLDEWLLEQGWYCHRRDTRFRKGYWIYHYLGLAGGGFLEPDERYTQPALERKLRSLYSQDWDLSSADAQRALAALRLYGGQIDGVFGDLSTKAAGCFQAAWGLTADGIVDARTCRLLALVTAWRVTV